MLSATRKVTPFALLGLDTDDDSVFMDETVRDYCTAAGVEFTCSRPYRNLDEPYGTAAIVRRNG